MSTPLSSTIETLKVVIVQACKAIIAQAYGDGSYLNSIASFSIEGDARIPTKTVTVILRKVGTNG
jgi:hypothetical protein